VISHRYSIPEEFNEEQLMIRQMAADFLNNEIDPIRDRIEAGAGLSPSCSKKWANWVCSVPTCPPNTAVWSSIRIQIPLFPRYSVRSARSSVPFAARTGIGMLPVLYFGTDEQKSRFLPGMIAGDIKAAYCLTEPGGRL
jgi:alkylation response protein AidB-like acyl-CoA dehydrogenase